MDKNHLNGDKIQTCIAQVDRMGITYPHSAGISFRLIPHSSEVWKTYPLEMCITVYFFALLKKCKSYSHN